MIHTGELQSGINDFLEILSGEGITEKSRRELANGVQMILTDGGYTCRFNLYFSRKKGFSAIPAGGDDLLQDRILEFLDTERELPLKGTWTGSDEAGKGDYMGPLTAAAVFADAETAGRFREMGITDSKVLSNAAVRKLATRIRNNHPDVFSVVTINPHQYNLRFDELRHNGQNSLDLLAQCHAEAIADLLSRTGQPGRILIDKFCTESRISGLLPKGDYVLELRERAESDPAVAAASVLARDAYLMGLDKISSGYGIKAVSGSGKQTDSVCREFVRRYGRDVLGDIAKLHFKNTNRIVDLFTLSEG